jgi:hypothetical protein
MTVETLMNKAGLELGVNRGATNQQWMGLAKFSSLFLLALGISFISAVVDRFGVWGVYGRSNVAWGNYARFVDYTAKLNWFLPAAKIPALAIIATAAETLFGVLLVLGSAKRSPSDYFCTDDDDGFGSEGPSICLSFQLRGSAAPRHVCKFSVQP